VIVPGIVFVTPPSTPEPPPVDPGRVHYRLWWEGWDGSNWSLTDDDSGLVLGRGVRGLGGLLVEHHRDDHASLAGSRWRGFRALNREVFLPIHLFSDGDSLDWVKHNRAFWKTMRSGKTGWLHIVHPDGHHRKIQLRYEKGGEEAFELDPAFYGWATYGIYLTAEQPYWEGDPVVAGPWRSAAPVPFLGGTETPGYAPMFGVSEQQTIGSATVNNPGDVETWGKWIYRGPADSATVGVGGRTVGIPIALATGERIEIDENPTEQVALLYSGDTVTDVTDQLSSFDFTEIPEGQDVPVDVELISASGGSIELHYTPLYEWGVS
jgi:hypothetical protein